MDKLWDWGFKILSALVIPLVLWGVSLQVRLAVQDTKIIQMQADIKEAQGIQTALNANTNAVGQLEVKINNVKEQLGDIKSLLDRSR